MAASTIASDLVVLIAQLKQQHKAGITPTFGQVDDLFEYGERLGVALQAGSLTEPVPDCTVDGCPWPTAGDVARLPYCAVHGGEARQLLDALHRLMPAAFDRITRVDWPLDSQTPAAGAIELVTVGRR